MTADLQVELTQPRTRAFRALRKRNVQLYFLGLLVSQAGTYMQIVAEGWLVYQLTNSAFSLGLVSFVAMIPLAPWGLVAGALADRMSRRKLLAIAVVGEAIPPLVLAALAWTGQAQVWQIVVCDVLLGGMSMLDFASRVALIYSLVERDEVENGIALAASLTNIARIVGPALAGILIGVVGVAGAFALNGLSFLFVLVMLVFIKAPKVQPTARRATLAANLVEVVLHIFRDRSILLMFMMMLVAAVFVLPFQTLLPVFARDILVAGPEGLGFLTAAAGVGAVFAAIVLASQPPISSRRRLGLAAAITIALAPVAAAFAFSRSLILSALLLALVSGGFVALRTISFTYVHLQTGDEMRGRISSILQMTMVATMRIGGLFAGFVASFAGAPLSLGLGALICLLFGLLALGLIFPQLRAEEVPA